jgi:hypothetical protein
MKIGVKDGRTKKWKKQNNKSTEKKKRTINGK